MILKNILIKIKDFFRQFFHEETKVVEPKKDSQPRRAYNRSADYRNRRAYNKNKRDTKNKDSAKLAVFLLVSSTILVLFSGCGKNQDLKIVHNYWDKTVEFKGKKEQAVMDLYVYKKFKDQQGKDHVLVYKAD